MENKTYADAFGIISGLGDLKIDFMSVDVTPAENGSVSEHRKVEHRVAMSLPLAKDLSKKLATAISAYEENFGVILDLDEIQAKVKELQNG